MIKLLMLFALLFQDRQPFITEENGKLILHFDEQGEGMTLESFIKVCQQNTGYNFTYSDSAKTRLTNKIRVIGPKTLDKDRFYSFFQTIMKFNEFLCVEVGKGSEKLILITDIQGGNPQNKAIAANNAVFISDPKDLENYASQPGVVVTTVFPLKYQDASRLGASLRQYFPDQSLEKVFNVGSSGILITSYGPNVYAVKRLLDLIDVPPEKSEPPVIEQVQLEFAAAEEILPILTELTERRSRNRVGGAVRSVEGATASIPQDEVEIKITPDGRTNSLFVQASKDDINWVLDLIQRLDSKLESPESNYHVYQVKNVESKTLADNLQKFLDQTQQAITSAANTARSTGGANAAQASTNSANREQKPVVVADEKSNAILITASKTKWAEIKNLLERLDVRQQQVLIETALVELTTQDNFNLGVELADISGTFFPGAGDIPKPGFVTSFGLSGITTDPLTGFPNGRNIVNDGGGLTSGNGILAGFVTGGNIQLPVILAALKERTNANVLSVPSVLVSNNSKAQIVSQETRQTQSQTLQNNQTQTSAGASGSAGITLNISPSISAANYLRLNIDLLVSSFQAVSSNFPSTILPPKTERHMTTSVFVPDGSTLYIGGVVVDNDSQTSSGVPILMDIPIIGQLFRNDSRGNNKTTLYFFITPRIIKEQDFSDIVSISYQKKLQANTTVGNEKFIQVDPKFNTLKADDNADLKKIQSNVFDIPIYRSPAQQESDKKEMEQKVDEKKPQ